MKALRWQGAAAAAADKAQAPQNKHTMGDSGAWAGGGRRREGRRQNSALLPFLVVVWIGGGDWCRGREELVLCGRARQLFNQS